MSEPGSNNKKIKKTHPNQVIPHTFEDDTAAINALSNVASDARKTYVAEENFSLSASHDDVVLMLDPNLLFAANERLKGMKKSKNVVKGLEVRDTLHLDSFDTEIEEEPDLDSQMEEEMDGEEERLQETLKSSKAEEDYAELAIQYPYVNPKYQYHDYDVNDIVMKTIESNSLKIENRDTGLLRSGIVLNDDGTLYKNKEKNRSYSVGYDLILRKGNIEYVARGSLETGLNDLIDSMSSGTYALGEHVVLMPVHLPDAHHWCLAMLTLTVESQGDSVHFGPHFKLSVVDSLFREDKGAIVLQWLTTVFEELLNDYVQENTDPIIKGEFFGTKIQSDLYSCGAHTADHAIRIVLGMSLDTSNEKCTLDDDMQLRQQQIDITGEDFKKRQMKILPAESQEMNDEEQEKHQEERAAQLRKDTIDKVRAETNLLERLDKYAKGLYAFLEDDYAGYELLNKFVSNEGNMHRLNTDMNYACSVDIDALINSSTTSTQKVRELFETQYDKLNEFGLASAVLAKKSNGDFSWMGESESNETDDANNLVMYLSGKDTILEVLKRIERIKAREKLLASQREKSKASPYININNASIKYSFQGPLDRNHKPNGMCHEMFSDIYSYQGMFFAGVKFGFGHSTINLRAFDNVELFFSGEADNKGEISSGTTKCIVGPVCNDTKYVCFEGTLDYGQAVGLGTVRYLTKDGSSDNYIDVRVQEKGVVHEYKRTIKSDTDALLTERQALLHHFVTYNKKGQFRIAIGENFQDSMGSIRKQAIATHFAGQGFAVHDTTNSAFTAVHPNHQEQKSDEVEVSNGGNSSRVRNLPAPLM